MEVDSVPKSLNPYIKLFKLDVEAYKKLNNHILEADRFVELENQSNQLIENTQTLQVVLKRIKIFECNECLFCYTTQRDYRLHVLKHAKPIVNTEFSYEKYGNYIKRFECDECDMKFVAQSTLRAHAAVHVPYPHVCHCGIGYRQKTDLVAHKKLVHHEDEERNVWKPKTKYAGKKEKSEFCIKSEYVTPESDAIKTKLGVYIPKTVKLDKSKTKRKKIRRDSTCSNSDVLTRVKYEKIVVDGNTRYQCPICHKAYSYHSIKQHNTVHSGERPYKCDICGKCFTQTGALNTHKVRHEGATFECPVCKKLLSSKCSVNLHMRVHTKEKPYKCDYCEKAFADPSAFARHIRTHTGDKRYKCKECPMSFTDASGLIAHRKRHIGIKTVQCEICDKKFYSKSEQKKHILTVHAHQYLYECDYCTKRFATKKSLQDHIGRNGVHSAWACKYCPRKFYSKQLRQKHFNIHKKLEFDDYECDLCAATFCTKASVAKHLKMEHN